MDGFIAFASMSTLPRPMSSISMCMRVRGGVTGLRQKRHACKPQRPRAIGIANTCIPQQPRSIGIAQSVGLLNWGLTIGTLCDHYNDKPCTV